MSLLIGGMLLNVEIGARIMRDGWFENLLGIVIFLFFFILVVSCPEKEPKEYCRPDSVMVEVHGNFYKCGEK